MDWKSIHKAAAKQAATVMQLYTLATIVGLGIGFGLVAAAQFSTAFDLVTVLWLEK